MAVKTKQAVKLTTHPAATAFPMMDKDTYKAFKADIKARGVLEPILVDGTQILDGRNRYAACEELAITPPIVAYKGTDAIGEVISRNIHRRHLTDDQRVAIVAKLRGKTLAKEGKAAQFGKGAKAGFAHERLAKEAKVTGSKAKAALAAAKHAPGALESVISGKSKLSAAAKAAGVAKKAKDTKAGKVKVKKELSLQERVEIKFLKFMQQWTVVEYPQVRAIIRELVDTAEKKGQHATK